MLENNDQKKTKSAPKYWIEKSGNLYARLQYVDEDGRTKDKYKKITEKREAKRAVADMRREMEIHGIEILLSDKMSFMELAEKYEQTKLVKAIYVDDIKVSGKRSISPVKSALKVLVDYFGRKKIRTIKLSDIEKYKNHRLNTPVVIIKNKKIELKEKIGRKKYTKIKVEHKHQRKISSVNRELETLRAMFNFAIENDWLIKNPFDKKKGVISKASENERDRILSKTEEERLLSQCIDKRSHLRPILICALDTAMRRGEMLKMRWREVNLETGEIFIPITNTKTDSERIVGMTSRLKNELKRLWRNSDKNLNSLVFGIISTVKNSFGKACQLAEIKDFKLHDCRHTATTRMICSGSAHTEVMKITGHTQLKTFLRYLSITQETAQICASRLDQYLAKS